MAFTEVFDEIATENEYNGRMVGGDDEEDREDRWGKRNEQCIYFHDVLHELN